MEVALRSRDTLPAGEVARAAFAAGRRPWGRPVASVVLGRAEWVAAGLHQGTREGFLG